MWLEPATLPLTASESTKETPADEQTPPAPTIAKVLILTGCEPASQGTRSSTGHFVGFVFGIRAHLLIRIYICLCKPADSPTVQCC